MSKFRDSYFEDYEATPYIDDQGKQRVRYIYRGDWIRLGLGEGLWKRKVLHAALEIFGVAVLAFSSTRPVDFNRSRAVAALSIISYVPWLLELWGSARFCLSRKYIRAFDRKTMDWQIGTGGGIRILLVLAAAAAGLVYTWRTGTLDGTAWLTAAGYLASALASAAVCLLWRKMGWRTFKNEDGKPGAEY